MIGYRPRNQEPEVVMVASLKRTDQSTPIMILQVIANCKSSHSCKGSFSQGLSSRQVIKISILRPNRSRLTDQTPLC
jgi:hypothetical protein